MLREKSWLNVTLTWAMLILNPGATPAQGENFEEIKKISASDADASDQFGNVTISGDTIVVGTGGNDDAGSNSGSAYIFERDQGGADNWGQVKKITASDAEASDQFGGALEISGDIVVIGAWGNDDAGANSGSAYVFSRDHGGSDNWGEVKKLTAEDAAAGDAFGVAIAISGDTVVVGAMTSDDACPADPDCNSGAVYIFERNLGGADNWGQVKKLTASDAAAYHEFGRSVAISADTIIAGRYNDPGGDPGAVYVFGRNEGGVDNWGEIKKLTASDAGASDQFGISISIEGDTLVVGARANDDVCPADPNCNSGSVYVFERDQGGLGNWGESRKLVASDAAAGDSFGFSASIFEDTVVIGAVGDDDAGDSTGSIYVVERNQGGAGNWGETGKYVASDASAGNLLASTLEISGGIIVASSHLDDDACLPGLNCNSGAAYIFTRAAGSPSLTIPELVPASYNQPVTVPIRFAANGQNIAATIFSVDFDEVCLNFDPTDNNSDGIPDSVIFSVPSGFASDVTFAAADTMGELDFVIADFSAPLAALSDGVLATITFTTICNPAVTSTIAPVNFGLMPAASFGTTAGQSVPGTTLNGSVEILAGVPGDCNADGMIDAGDISACVLEVFDGDGNVWTDVPQGTFLGNPVGCDANQDLVVDAGDLSCKILLIFNGPGACVPSQLYRSPLPELRLGTGVSAEVGEEVTIPMTFNGNGQHITAGTFVIDYDENCLSFDPSTGIAFELPNGLIPSVTFDDDDSAGELQISFFDTTLPFATLSDGLVATMTFTTTCDPSHQKFSAVRFGSAPLLSFGDVSGRSVSGIGVGGGVLGFLPIFTDDFESGDFSAWSNVSP